MVTKTVLVIDDETHVFLAIKKIIDWNKYNYTIEYAKNGKDGLNSINELKPHIVFIDMNMPVMNGIEFLKNVHNKYPGTRFIIVSGYSDFVYAKAGIQYGACEYILKPLDRLELENIVFKHINTSTETEDSMDENDIYVVISEIKDFIENHYFEDIKVSTFASKYFFTKEYISKTYRKIYNIGIYEYVLKLRMERALTLLQENELKISDISTRLGYSNNNYFSKAFKTYYGVAPSNFQNIND